MPTPQIRGLSPPLAAGAEAEKEEALSGALSPTPTAAVPGPGLSPPVGTHTHTHTLTYALCTSSQGPCLPNTSSPSPHCTLFPWSPRGWGWARAPPSPSPCSCMAPDTGQWVRLVVPLPQTIKPRWSVQGVLALLPSPAWGSQRSLGRGHCDLHCPHRSCAGNKGHLQNPSVPAVGAPSQAPQPCPNTKWVLTPRLY